MLPVTAELETAKAALVAAEVAVCCSAKASKVSVVGKLGIAKTTLLGAELKVC